VRLDKYISECGVCSRTEAARAVRTGALLVNGLPVRSASCDIVPERDMVTYNGVPVKDRRNCFWMLHKPQGVVSATEDGKDPTVLDLLPPELRRIGLFPCGRLDKNTTGLVLLTNDGQLAHQLLAPKNHVEKKYLFTVKFPYSDEDASAIEAGLDIGGYVTAPCRMERFDETSGAIWLTEGKYHEIKLLMEARHNQIRSLQRVSFGPIVLPPDLEQGAFRELTADEMAALRAAVSHKT